MAKTVNVAPCPFSPLPAPPLFPFSAATTAVLMLQLQLSLPQPLTSYLSIMLPVPISVMMPIPVLMPFPLLSFIILFHVTAVRKSMWLFAKLIYKPQPISLLCYIKNTNFLLYSLQTLYYTMNHGQNHHYNGVRQV